MAASIIRPKMYPGGRLSRELVYDYFRLPLTAIGGAVRDSKAPVSSDNAHNAQIADLRTDQVASISPPQVLDFDLASLLSFRTFRASRKGAIDRKYSANRSLSCGLNASKEGVRVGLCLKLLQGCLPTAPLFTLQPRHPNRCYSGYSGFIL